MRTLVPMGSATGCHWEACQHCVGYTVSWMMLAVNPCSQPHLRSHSPPQDPLLMHQHRRVLLAQVPGDTGKQQRQEQHEQEARAPASEQVHAREKQEMYTSLEPRKYKGFKNNTPGSRHRNNGWHRFFRTTKQSTRPAGILAAARGCTLQYRRTYMPQILNHKGF